MYMEMDSIASTKHCVELRVFEAVLSRATRKPVHHGLAVVGVEKRRLIWLQLSEHESANGLQHPATRQRLASPRGARSVAGAAVVDEARVHVLVSREGGAVTEAEHSVHLLAQELDHSASSGQRVRAKLTASIKTRRPKKLRYALFSFEDK